MDVYSILAHPMRRKILYLLEEGGFIPYTELMVKLGVKQTGQLNFHLKKLNNLVSKDKKSYYLTDDGKRILRMIGLNKRILSGEEIDYLKSKGSEINRIGVIICNCNTEVSNVLNTKSLYNYVSKINDVVSVKIFDNLCQEKNQDKINNWINDNFINKIVIAACSPKTHQHIFESLFQNIVDRANIEIANIREQCCWVHFSSKKDNNSLLVLKKAQLIIEASVNRVRLQKRIKIKRVEVEKSCAIVGGGIAGMKIALNLARTGIKCYLIEKSPTLGGKVSRWQRLSNMGDCSACFISELIGEIVKEKEIEILTNTEIVSVSGEVGNFTIGLIKKPRYVDEAKCTGCKQCIDICAQEKFNKYEFELTKRKIIHFPFQYCYPYIPVVDKEDIADCLECGICERACANKAIDLLEKPQKIRIKVGAKVIAIGSDLYSNLKEYNYNPQNDVITSAEFERILSSDGLTGGKIVKLSDGKPVKTLSIIQEVGSSNYLCEYSDILALKYIDVIRVKNPNCEVNVFYDLSKLKEKDEIILKSTHPRFLYANKILIETRESFNYVVADSIEFPSDLIVLNLKLIPNKDLKSLRKIMHFTLNDHGFMSEETLASGIYGVGTIFGPLNYHSTVATTNNIALKVISLLSNNMLITEYTGIEINEEKCGMCKLCVNSCPYNAISINSEKLIIDKFKCKACGMCVSVCPTNAIEMNINTSEKILKSIEVFSKFNEKPKIIAFCCQSCGYAAADDAGLKKLLYRPNVFIISVPCAGRIDTEFIIKSFEMGFDGVMVIGCRNDSCRYIDGIEKLKRRVRLLIEILGRKFKKRIIVMGVNGVEGSVFSELANKFYNLLKEEIKIEA
ncbi:MAG: hydrogenase iron-sulfur subunit [Candidatus Lokiarchaeota archaeon]|nr:hydrogenase iron-sulfur subunit [Candidatus Lokiarchaeota archaeon]